MPVTFVQGDEGIDDGPVILNGIAATSTVCCFILGQTSLATTTLPAGWLKQTPVANGADMFGCWWVYPEHPGGNVSATVTNAPTVCRWHTLEYSGGDPVLPVEDEVTNTGSSQTWSLSNVAVSEGGALVCAAGQPFTEHTLTETAVGLATRTIHDSASADATFSAENMVVGAYSPSGSVAASGTPPWVAAGLALLALTPREGDRSHLTHLLGR